MFKDKIKSLVIKKDEGNNKKTIENLVVFLILLIVTIVAINMIWGKEEKKAEENRVETEHTVLAEDVKNSNTKEPNAYNIEQELEDVLSKIDGVGKVKVLITYSESSQIVAMYNENKNISVTEETDSEGGVRTIESTDANKEIILDGESKPITEKVVMPKIEGAIIIAEGGGDAILKSNIVQAVSAVTGLASHKIQVFKMSN